MRIAPRGTAALATMLAGTVLAGTVVAGTALLGTGTATAAPPTNVLSGPVQLDADGPLRIYDSRNSGGPIASQEFGHSVIRVGSFVPPTAKAVLVTVTAVATRPGSSGFVAASGEAYRGTSTATWTQPGVYANFAVVPVYLNSVTGELTFDLRYQGSQPIDVVVDLQGWI